MVLKNASQFYEKRTKNHRLHLMLQRNYFGQLLQFAPAKVGFEQNEEILRLSPNVQIKSLSLIEVRDYKDLEKVKYL